MKFINKEKATRSKDLPSLSLEIFYSLIIVQFTKSHVHWLCFFNYTLFSSDKIHLNCTYARLNRKLIS